MIESLFLNSTSNRYKFVMTPTRGKNLWPPLQKWNDDSTFRNTKDSREHALLNYTK